MDKTKFDALLDVLIADAIRQIVTVEMKYDRLKETLRKLRDVREGQ